MKHVNDLKTKQSSDIKCSSEKES